MLMRKTQLKRRLYNIFFSCNIKGDTNDNGTARLRVLCKAIIEKQLDSDNAVEEDDDDDEDNDNKIRDKDIGKGILSASFLDIDIAEENVNIDVELDVVQNEIEKKMSAGDMGAVLCKKTLFVCYNTV